MKIRALIVDDEISGRETLLGYLETYCPTIHVIGTADSVDSAVKTILKKKPDLVFLDVKLYDKKGFEIYDYLGDQVPQVIFVTAFPESGFAIEALRKDACDFLKKPVNIQELIGAVARVNQKIAEGWRQQALERLNAQYLRIQIAQKGNEIEFVKLSDIIMFEADHGFTNVFLQAASRPKLLSASLKSLEGWLPKSLFMRVHHKYIINLMYLERFQSKPKGGVVFLAGEHKALVSTAKRSEFLEKSRMLLGQG